MAVTDNELCLVLANTISCLTSSNIKTLNFSGLKPPQNAPIKWWTICTKKLSLDIRWAISKFRQHNIYTTDEAIYTSLNILHVMAFINYLTKMSDIIWFHNRVGFTWNSYMQHCFHGITGRCNRYWMISCTYI